MPCWQTSMAWVSRVRRWSSSGATNTWHLPARRRNARECTTRSRSRWNSLRVGDGDTGPNTGGMGVYSPVPVAGPEVVEAVLEQAVAPTLVTWTVGEVSLVLDASARCPGGDVYIGAARYVRVSAKRTGGDGTSSLLLLCTGGSVR